MRLLAIVAVALTATPACAGFDTWTAAAEKDPFSGGQSVTVDYMQSIRNGVFIRCDSTDDGITIRLVPGWAYVPDIEGLKPVVEFAVDGERLPSVTGLTNSVRDNLAAADVELKGSDGRNFVRAFAAAQRQIAIKDGMSDAPYLLTARGSTKSGAALLACLRQQPGWIAQ